MQPFPPSRRRRRASRAAGPPTPTGPVPAGGAPGEGPSTRDDRTDDDVTAPYRVVDPVPTDGSAGAPVVPPSPPPADVRRPGPIDDTDARVSPPRTAPATPTGRAAPWEPGSRRSRAREEQGERALRALVTQRGSQVSPSTALRAREVETPTADDLTRAEQEVVLVRRHYVPPTALPPGRRPARNRADQSGSERRRSRGGD